MQLVKTTSEQRSEIYEDLRQLLVPGFLAHPVSVNGVHLVLRSLDSSDWYMLRYRAHGSSEQQWRAWVVAESTWMVNGSVLLREEDARPLLYQMCVALPSNALANLYGVVIALLRRARTAATRIEGFLYEDESRQLWHSDGQALLAREGHHGILLPKNPILKLWIYYNQVEDQREHNDYLWSLAKFQAGPHAPKGIKKVNAQDAKRANELVARRQQVMDRTYYVAKGMIDDTPEGQAAGKRRFQEVIEAQSPEELREEMRRWVAGEKDDHDRVVEAIKTKIRTEVEGRRERERLRREALQKALEDEGFKPSRLVPLSGKAGQEFLERVKAKVPGVSKVLDDRTHNSAYEKYIAKPAAVGTLQVGDDGLVHEGEGADPRMIEMMRKPSPGDPGSLQQQIEQRRPTVTFVDRKDEE